MFRPKIARDVHDLEHRKLRKRKLRGRKLRGHGVYNLFIVIFPGYLPVPPNFTTVGKPQIVVNQYDSPLDVYSDDTLEEMKEERLTMQNPEVVERINQKLPASDNPLAAMQARQFDPSKSNVLGAIID